RPAERQRGQQSGREASRAAERPAERQRGQQSGREASRAAERPAERQKGQQSGRKASRQTKTGRNAGRLAERPTDNQKPTAGQNDQTNTNKKQIFNLQKRKRKVYLKNENQKTNSNHEKHTRASTT
ncbi:hypothetical protein, partial [Thiolapillus sp.]|uniref:hypothetical protein n=1 Tax=Thiolapillus sp. TaxID=2017437 RepID=UPI003AF7E3D8